MRRVWKRPDSKDTPAEAGHELTYADGVRLAERYVCAYNDRDLDAMLALMDENIVSYPSRLFGARRDVGHAAVRAWWGTMVASGRWYQVAIHDVRQVGPEQFAVLGEILDAGERLSPWGVVVRVRRGLIVESRSYLSDVELLEALGVLEDQAPGSAA